MSQSHIVRVSARSFRAGIFTLSVCARAWLGKMHASVASACSFGFQCGDLPRQGGSYFPRMLTALVCCCCLWCFCCATCVIPCALCIGIAAGDGMKCCCGRAAVPCFGQQSTGLSKHSLCIHQPLRRCEDDEVNAMTTRQ